MFKENAEGEWVKNSSNNFQYQEPKATPEPQANRVINSIKLQKRYRDEPFTSIGQEHRT